MSIATQFARYESTVLAAVLKSAEEKGMSGETLAFFKKTQRAAFYSGFVSGAVTLIDNVQKTGAPPALEALNFNEEATFSLNPANHGKTYPGSELGGINNLIAAIIGSGKSNGNVDIHRDKDGVTVVNIGL